MDSPSQVVDGDLQQTTNPFIDTVLSQQLAGDDQMLHDMYFRHAPEGWRDPITEFCHSQFVQLQNSSPSQMADKIRMAVRDAEKVGHELRNRVKDMAGEMSWTQNLALAVLARVEDAIQTGISKVGALKEAFEKATEAAVDFAREHPVYATLIALGILVVLFPWVIEALGFGLEGPIEGTSKLSSNFLHGIGEPDIRLGDFRELRSVVAVKVCRICAQRLIVLVLTTSGHGVEEGTSCVIGR